MVRANPSFPQPRPWRKWWGILGKSGSGDKWQTPGISSSRHQPRCHSAGSPSARRSPTRTQTENRAACEKLGQAWQGEFSLSMTSPKTSSFRLLFFLFCNLRLENYMEWNNYFLCVLFVLWPVAFVCYLYIGPLLLNSPQDIPPVQTCPFHQPCGSPTLGRKFSFACHLSFHETENARLFPGITQFWGHCHHSDFW